MNKIHFKSLDQIQFHKDLAALLGSTASLAAFCEETLKLLLSSSSIKQMAMIIHDTNKGIVTFPFALNLHESSKPQAYHDINSPLLRVLQNAEPLMVRQEDYSAHCQDKVTPDTPPVLWAGCPILCDEQPLGAIILSADTKADIEAIETLFPSLLHFCEIVSPYLKAKTSIENITASEEKYRRLADSSIDITFQITLNGYISYISSNVKTLFGIDPRQLIGKHFESFTFKNQVTKIRQALNIIGTGKNVQGLQINQRDVSGVTTPMEINGSPIYRDNKIIGAQGTIRDISERHQAQQEIERLSFFPMTNPMPVVEIDLQGVPSYINPAGIQLLDRMNLDMSQVAQILPPTFQQDISEALNKKGTIIPSREVSLDGYHLLWSAFFLENQDLLHYYGTDITTLKKTEQELIDAKRIAVKNEQVKTLFLANMSHEIRTPLNSILGFTELIEEEVKHNYDTDLKSYFDIIRASGKRLWTTVHEILDISQIESGTFTLKIETIDLGHILKEILNIFETNALDKKLDLQVKIPDKPLQIAADAYCATQAISNLVDNAIKYTNEGFVKITAEERGDSVIVRIQDTGIGMSKEYQEQMFNAFSQESTGYTKHFQGVGLGLALAHRYLRLIKSEIELVSEQNIGSTFIITFPINPRAPLFQFDHKTRLVSKVSETPVKMPKNRANILIVEDDPNSRKLAELTLRKEFDLSFAESVYEAKERLHSNEIHLVLLDLSLRGDEDGLDLVHYIRGENSLKAIPVIALTAHAFTSDRDRCMEAGCDEFLTKPFRRADLLDMIYKLVR